MLVGRVVVEFAVLRFGRADELVAAGRTAFDSVLQDPAAFTPYVIDLIWAEPLLYTPDRAYERITGEEWDRDTRYSYESCSNTEGWAD